MASRTSKTAKAAVATPPSVEAMVRRALAAVLAATAPRWGVDPGALHVLAGPPQSSGDLPGLTVTFPAARTVPAGIGGVVGISREQPDAPRSILGLRFEATARLDLWVKRQSSATASLAELTALSTFLSEALRASSVPLRKAGILRLHALTAGEISDAAVLPAWVITGSGLLQSFTCELVYESTYAPEQTEGVIRTVVGTLQADSKSENVRVP